MESQDLVSVSRRASRPVLQVLVSNVSGLVSVSKVSGLETLNITNKWFITISIIQRFSFVVFAGKKQPKHVGRMPEIWKKFKSEVMTKFFQNFLQNGQIVKSRVSVLNFKSRVSVSEFLMKSRSRLEILIRTRSQRWRYRLDHCWFLISFCQQKCIQVPLSLDKYFIYHICFMNNNERKVGVLICTSSLQSERIWQTHDEQST